MEASNKIDDSQLKHKMNLYIKDKGQFILVLTGLSGSNKNMITKILETTLDLKVINYKKFLTKDYNKTYVLPSGTKIINESSDDYINWELFNDEINKEKENGIIVLSPVFPLDRMNFMSDIHINLFVSKQYLKDNVTKILNEQNKLNEIQDELLKINILIYPYYIDVSKRSKYSITYDVSKYASDFNILTDNIINFISSFINKKIEDVYTNTKASTKSERQKKDKSRTSKFYESLDKFFNLKERFNYELSEEDVKGNTEFYSFSTGDDESLLVLHY